MYDSEDLRNCTSEFHKRSLEVANSPLREALKVEKKSVIFKKFFPISCTNLQKFLLNQRIVSSIYHKDLGSFFTLSMLKVYLVI